MKEKDEEPVFKIIKIEFFFYPSVNFIVPE